VAHNPCYSVLKSRKLDKVELRYEVRRWILSGTCLELLMHLEASPDGVADAVIEASY
jgi:hypothetical protein